MATPRNDYHHLRDAPIAELRAAIRSGAYTGQTAGLAPGLLQANLAILPRDHAVDFLHFCQLNPKPCPLVGMSEPGDPSLPSLGAHLDLRTDVPAYHVYRDGALAGTASDLRELWRDDLVAFALGCSFTFERALIEDGIALDHIARNRVVPMYRTNIETRPAGPFGGSTVVSMRPIAASDVACATEISERYPHAHGGPLHVGAPGEIGIDTLDQPDWGDPTPVPAGAEPVFWACGVTPQAAVLRARLPFCITHKPGHMLVTDVDERADIPVFQSHQAETT
ncbi:MAG: putative hydro-lyase [Pseudomonadota bacterium]